MMTSCEITPDHGNQQPSHGRLPCPLATFNAFALSIIAACTFAVSCGKKDETPPAPSVPESAGTNASTSVVVKPEFAKLIGKWERPDGGYVVEIKGVDPSGKLDVAYFNPNPIKVSRAAALQKEGATHVFIELRDVNYPGSTYTLTYDPNSDQLYGQYFQAAMQQTFDVTFARVKNGSTPP